MEQLNDILVKVKNIKIEGDKQIWWIAFALSIFSILVVYSASGGQAAKINPEWLLLKHIFHLSLAWGFMYACSQVQYVQFARFAQLATILCVPLLIWAKFSPAINDAHRWISVAGISFQPSELAKIALVTSLATMLARRTKVNYKENPFQLISMIAFCVVICGFIAISNVSSAIMLLSTCFVILYIGGVGVKNLLILVGGGLVIIGIVVLFLSERKATAQKRISSYSEAFMDDTKADKQLKDAYKAIAYGNLMGVGPGQSHQRNFLAYGYAEYIFAIIAEEYGLWGSLLVIALYIWLMNRAFKILNNTNRALGGFMAIGIAFTIGIQAFANIAVTLGILPNTGLTLPLLSMGGTSLSINGIAFGILISTSRGDFEEAI